MLAACASADAASTDRSGIDTQYIDPSVRVQDDFFAYLNGKWLKTTDIPADRASWGAFMKLREDTQPQLLGIIEADQKDPHKKAGTDAQKIADLYASFMDEKKLETLGYKPLTGELARIRTLKDKKGVPGLIAHLSKIGVATPYGIGVSQDAKASTRYAVYIRQGGLGMPDRDYYLKADDVKLAATRAKYQTHVAKILQLAGDKDAEAKARAIVAFETGLAKAQWTKVELRDPNKNYNRMDVAQLTALTPGYDWKTALGAAGVGNKVDYVIVGQPGYLQALDQLLADTDLETVKAYFEWQLLREYAPYLSKAFVDEDFDFYGRTLTGVDVNRPRWKIGVSVVEGAMGEALGREYVARYFPPERKARMEELVKNVLAAYRESIDHLDWMGPETKQEAQAKLAKFTPKIGYPNKWRDYSRLAVKHDDLAGNVERAAVFAYNRNIDKLGKPIDREEWGMTPQTVNAYYNSRMNEIVFPAAILQPPFFDADADDAANYGGIGAVIGHEIGHGFDDQGSKYDGDGNLTDWWEADDRAEFERRAKALIAQYDALTPAGLAEHHVNGALTVGENIGDLGGLTIALRAYRIAMDGAESPVLDGFTGLQRVLLGWAQVWRAVTRDEEALRRLAVDPHSPPDLRCNAVVTNLDAFHDAFGVQETDALFTPPGQRVRIW
jgi:predicted metalloendopeptidase